jgi:hypothetical protein
MVLRLKAGNACGERTASAVTRSSASAEDTVSLLAIRSVCSNSSCRASPGGKTLKNSGMFYLNAPL